MQPVLTKNMKSTNAKRKPEERNEALMKLRFQNYNPRTEELKKYCEESADPGELLEQITREHDELIKATNRRFADPSLDLDNLVPRKGTWDMEKSLAPKLERLEKRTQRALLQIVQRKLAAEQELDDVPDQPDLSSDED